MIQPGRDQGALCVHKAQQGVIARGGWRFGLVALLVLALVSACTRDAAEPPASPAAGMAPSDPAAERSTPAAFRHVLVMGDSLSAAYNLAAEQGWVALLDARMRQDAPGYRMVNASISGETSAGGASRIEAALTEHRPTLVVIELGANDGLRGLPLDATRANLERMVRAAKASGADVLLVGMRLPPNYGPDYTEDFAALFGEIAAAEGVTHLPFLLEPIARDAGAFQADGLHPTAEAQVLIADHVWSRLRPMLAD